jgi:hypothetical protein
MQRGREGGASAGPSAEQASLHTIEADAPQDAAAELEALLPFVVASPEQVRRALELVHLAYTGRRVGPGRLSQFPGPNPISMDPEFIDVVRSRPYVCSPKVDGTRLQLVAWKARGASQSCFVEPRSEGVLGGARCAGTTAAPPPGGTTAAPPPGDTVCLVDRRMRVFGCTYAHLPASSFCDPGTVLDAEMVGDALYVFDAVMLAGDASVSRRGYTDRLAAVTRWAAGGSPAVGFGAAVLRVLVKPVFPASMARRLLVDPAALGFTDRCDGIVLTPVADPVCVFTAWNVYKVKPHHTLDFRLVMVPNRPLRAFANRALTVPDSVAQTMQGPILRNALSPSSCAPASLLSYSGASETGRKRPRPGTLQMFAHVPPSKLRATPSQPAAAAAGSGGGEPSQVSPEEPVGRSEAVPPEPPAASSAPSVRPQWILRLEYAHGSDTKDATRDGIDYNGRRVVLRIVENEALVAILDKVEETWLAMQEDVVAMSLIAECRIELTPDMLSGAGGDEIYCAAPVEKPRPDKHEPNNYLTITRTLTSILHGVTEKHLACLERA